MNLKACYLIFKAEIGARVSYRGRLVTELGLQSLKLVLPVLTWKALFAQDNHFGAYSFAAMVAYIIIMNFIGFVFTMAHGSELAGLIKSGKLSAWILRPFSIESSLLPKFAARALFNAMIILVPATVLVLVTNKAFEIQMGLQGALLVMLNLVFCYYFALLFGICAFWIDEVWPLSHLVRSLIAVAGGVLFPLDMLPKGVAAVLSHSPFAHLGYLNGAAILGKLSAGDLDQACVRAVLWIIVAISIYKFCLKIGLKRYESVGG